MYSILVCEESLYYEAKNLFASYNVDLAINSEDILNLTYENSYDIYIVNFYFYNTIKDLKDGGDNAIVIFIDQYYNIYNIKLAFDIGDEYLIKPLSIEELQIRVNYYFKKLYQKKSNIIRYKSFFYHIFAKQLYLKNVQIKLSPNEVKIVELFLLNINKPISKDTIYETLQSYSDGSLRVYISRLKKLQLDISYNRTTVSYMLCL